MDLKRDKQPIDLVFAAYSVILGGVWLFATETSVTSQILFALHLGVAWILLQLPAPDTRESVLRKILHHGYPYILWILAWTEIGWLHRLNAPTGHDAGVLALDLSLFGVHWHDRWPEIMPWPGLGETLQLAYLSYYLLILGPPVALALARRRETFDRLTLVLMTTYLACFLVYLVYPVFGPRALAVSAGAAIPPGEGGVIASLVEALRRAGDSPGTAFPSSHCAGVTAMALSAQRCFAPTTGRLLAVWAALVVVSTVYTRNHYALDATAGVAVAVFIQRLGMLAERYRFSFARRTERGRRRLVRSSSIVR